MGLKDLNLLRAWFAEEIKYQGGISSDEIISAFSEVPREDFFPRGPWQLLSIGELSNLSQFKTVDDDPAHLYHNVLISIDPRRGLNSGMPSWVARTMDVANPRPGEHVVHIGAGLGYYSAIFSKIVGPRGRVTAIEIDSGLAEFAKENLLPYPNVTFLEGDGTSIEFGPADVIFVNAGTTHFVDSWINNLNPNGRLIVPLTISQRGGRVFRVFKENNKYITKAMHSVSVFDCVGARDIEREELLANAVARNGWDFEGEIRFDIDKKDYSCWLDYGSYWLSSKTDS